MFVNISSKCLIILNNSLLIESHKPSSAKSDTTSVRPHTVSFEGVNKQGSNDDGQPLRIVQSTPSLKKGSPTRKLSYGKKVTFLKYTTSIPSSTRIVYREVEHPKARQRLLHKTSKY